MTTDQRGEPSFISNDQIKHMVGRFLGWSIPENFNPDGGVSFKRLEFNGKPYPMPNGTNLFDATQAEAMVRHMIEGLPLINEVGAAERQVGRAVYERIDKLMDAKTGTPEGAELAYLADMVSCVEEYGSWDGPDQRGETP